MADEKSVVSNVVEDIGEEDYSPEAVNPDLPDEHLMQHDTKTDTDKAGADGDKEADSKTKDDSATSDTGEDQGKKKDEKADDKAGDDKTGDDVEKAKENTDPGVQKRIDKITREKKIALDGETKALRQLADLKETIAKTGTDSDKSGDATDSDKSGDAPPEPKEEDFDDYEQWQTAHRKWFRQDVRRDILADIATKDAAEKEKTAADEYGIRIDGKLQVGREKYGTEIFDEIMNTLPTTQALFDTLLFSENTAEMAFHLDQNPDVLTRLTSIGDDPVAVALEFGKIEGKLLETLAAAAKSDEKADEKSDDTGDDKETPEKKEKEPKAPPAPQKPVNNSGGTGTFDINTATWEEHKKYMNALDKERGR